MSQKYLIETAQIIRQVRKEAPRTIEAAILYTYFNVGRMICETEQLNKRHSARIILNQISSQLTKENGKSYSVENLVLYKQFYLSYSARFSDNDLQKISKVWLESIADMQQYDSVIKSFKKKFRLTWLHYHFLISIESDKARDHLEKQAVQYAWSIDKLRLRFPEFKAEES